MQAHGNATIQITLDALQADFTPQRLREVLPPRAASDPATCNAQRAAFRVRHGGVLTPYSLQRARRRGIRQGKQHATQAHCATENVQPCNRAMLGAHRAAMRHAMRICSRWSTA
jgi:hypothetical protein